MRLIDADALMKKICGNECGSIYDEDCRRRWCNFYDYIMDSPTFTITVKDGTQAALEKIAAAIEPSEICLLHVMEWEDDGCCMNCIECVKNHFKEKGVAE